MPRNFGNVLLNYTITEKVSDCVAELKKEHTLGLDGIENELLKFCIHNIIPFLWQVINRCIKKTAVSHWAHNCQNDNLHWKKLQKFGRKPWTISFLNTFPKCFEGFCTNRCRTWFRKIFRLVSSASQTLVFVFKKFANWRITSKRKLSAGLPVMSYKKAFNTLDKKHCFNIKDLWVHRSENWYN